MRIKVAIAALAAFLALVGTAQAFQWHLPLGQAKHATREFAEESCRSDHRCTGFGVGACRRVSDSRVDCVAGLFYKDQPKPGEETECNIVLHWGVDSRGYLALKNHGSPNCFQT